MIESDLDAAPQLRCCERSVPPCLAHEAKLNKLTWTSWSKYTLARPEGGSENLPKIFEGKAAKRGQESFAGLQLELKLLNGVRPHLDLTLNVLPLELIRCRVGREEVREDVHGGGGSGEIQSQPW
jgi:hypothetical protein